MNVVQGHWQVQSQCVHVGQRGEYCMPPCAVVLVALELVLVMGAAGADANEDDADLIAC